MEEMFEKYLNGEKREMRLLLIDRLEEKLFNIARKSFNKGEIEDTREIYTILWGLNREKEDFESMKKIEGVLIELGIENSYLENYQDIGYGHADYIFYHNCDINNLN